MKKLLFLILIVFCFSCEKDIPETVCKVCTTIITGPGINRTYSETKCGNDLKNVDQGGKRIVIGGIICDSRTTCR